MKIFDKIASSFRVLRALARLSDQQLELVEKDLHQIGALKRQLEAEIAAGTRRCPCSSNNLKLDTEYDKEGIFHLKFTCRDCGQIVPN